MTPVRRARSVRGIRAVSIVTLLAFTAGPHYLASAADAAGSLLVKSDPAGAAVYVDGHLVGETPLTMPTISVGVHRVRVVRLGFLENRRLVTVKAGSRATVQAVLTDPAPQSAQIAALRIVVLEGEGAVNIIQQKTAVASVIEVRDRNDQPVSGAVVKFAIQKGKASFDGARTLTVTTNAAGRATATGFTATGRGAVQIATSAAFQGQTAATTIAQTTVMSAAEAATVAPATGAASAGGGLSHAAIAGIVGGAGAAVAGAVFAGNNGTPNRAPVVGGVTASPGAALLGTNRAIAFSMQATDGDNDALTYSWDFGDGGTATGASPTHVYTAAGTFTVRATVSDGKDSVSGQTSVVIRTMTGTWRTAGGIGFDGTYTLTQSGSALTGSYTLNVGALVGVVRGAITSGSVRPSSPHVMFMFTATWATLVPTCPAVSFPFTVTGDASADANSITGTLVADPSSCPEVSAVINIVPITLMRQ